jgi:membrane-bound lytic murein transglycosylase A
LGNGHLSILPLHVRIILGVCLALLFGACTETPKEPSKTTPFERVSRDELPKFQDDLDSQSLRAAVERSIAFFDRLPGERTFSLGAASVSAETLKSSLLDFLNLLEEDRLNPDSVAQVFDVYCTGHGKTPEQSLVTGYYEPIVEGRIEREADFSYPLYGVPPDLLTVELASFDPVSYPRERLIGRIQGNRVVPYYNRAEIDRDRRLEHCGCELAWLKDPIDVFFLQVQGSGIVRLSDGRLLRIGYAGANGRPYKSIGKVLIDRGAISSEAMSLQTLRTYLRNHPESRDELMWQNESYVFFRWTEEGPMGSLNVPLTAGRSIATDPRYCPGGAVGYLDTMKPQIDGTGQVSGWKPLRRWVVNQDTGGAIKGPGRVDLFCGTGEQAEGIAGRLKHPGMLCFLVKK